MLFLQYRQKNVRSTGWGGTYKTYKRTSASDDGFSSLLSLILGKVLRH